MADGERKKATLQEMGSGIIKCIVGTSEFCVKRLSLDQIAQELQGRYLAEVRSRILDDAKAFGLEGTEKIEFLSRASASMPDGIELQQTALEYMATLPGLRSLLQTAIEAAGEELPEGLMGELMSEDNIEQVCDVMEALFGIDMGNARAALGQEEPAPEPKDLGVITR